MESSILLDVGFYNKNLSEKLEKRLKNTVSEGKYYISGFFYNILGNKLNIK